MSSNAAKAYRSTRWVLASSIGSRAFGLFALGILLRLISKEEFGAYSQLVALHGVIIVILPLAFDQLVTKEARFRARYSAGLAGACALAAGSLVALSAALVLLPSPNAPLLARLLGFESDVRALWLLPLAIVLQATKLSLRGVLTARLEFPRIGAGEFMNSFITMFGAVALVQLWPSVLAVYLAYIAGELFEALWLWRARAHRAAWRLPTSARIFRALLPRHRGFVGFLTADLALNMFASAIPLLLLGALVSPAAAGDYGAASRAIMLPVMLLVGAVWRVLVPAVAGLPEEELQRRVLLVLTASAAFIVPIILWLGAFAPPVLAVLGGQQYVSAAPMMRWIALAMLPVGLLSAISGLDILRNRVDLGLYFNIALASLRAVATWFFAAAGAVPAVAAMTLAGTVAWIGWGAILSKLLGAGDRRFVGAFAGFIPLWGMLLGGYAVTVWLFEGRHPAIAVAASVAPSLVYGGAVLAMRPELRDVVHGLLGRR